jgi:uncharacterized protein (DUF433 family)
MSYDNQLIQQYITDEAIDDSHKRNEPVMTRTGSPVWGVVGYCLRACEGSVTSAAKDYALTEEEVKAALAYYRQHPEMDICREEGTDRAPELVPG